nr:xanthine dehydrogenase small subunit [Sessilibacter corallicola]
MCLNGQWLELENSDPSETLLHYLRTKLGQNGTKEGCASGDCGACTVVVAQYSEATQSWQYHSINSCITLLASLHGKHIITVEGIAESYEGEASLSHLHPVQRALVEHHGSQCGFCTPGIVMSLFTAYENNGGAALTENQILDSLSGNLCRCTGYRPIVDAGLEAHQYSKAGQYSKVGHYSKQTTPEKTYTTETACFKTDTAQCIFPASEEELIQLITQHPQARFVAGGTDLMLEKTQAFKSLPQLIGLTHIDSLREITITNNNVSVGCGVTFSDLERELKDRLPSLVALFHRIGSRQIRNQGTLAGNIANASPIGDSPPFLLALDATLELNGPNGLRVVELNDFFIDYKKTELQPGEYIRRVLFEIPNDNFVQSYKISKRFEDDISAALLVVRWSVDNNYFKNVRVSVGGMASTAKRVVSVENALEGQPANQETISTAKALFKTELSPISDVRASAHYRITVIENLLMKAWLEFSNNHAAKTQCVNVWQPNVERKVSQQFGGDYA